MKTTMMKITLLGIAGAIAFALCSFTTNVSTVKVNPTSVLEDEWAEWNKVQEFVTTNITEVIQKNDKSNGKSSYKSFSRCPSGYNANIAGEHENVKVDRNVFGTIVLYNGCSPKKICDFKVCVDKGIALVKNKESKDYIPVSEWLSQKENSKGSLVKG